MKKIYLMMWSLMVSMLVTVNAQTILDEGFEHTQGTEPTTTLPNGWSAVTSYKGSTTGYRWTIGHSTNSGGTMTGFYYAYCDGPTYDKGDNDGIGPRKDYLITPELNLNDTYQLSFDWKAAAASVLNTKAYTFQVAIIDMANPTDTTVIFDITNEQQVRDSGVAPDPYGNYIWQNWGMLKSKLDLSPYKGKKVKIAFIYDMLMKTANIIYLDNINVTQHEAVNTPIPQLSQSSYQFEPMYLGEKHYSEVLTIKNVGKSGLKVTGFETPDGMGVQMDTAGMNLSLNATAKFQVYYKAGLTTPVEGDVVIKTNGGDATLHVTAVKQALPDGYQLELFEGNQFPPAGWTNQGFGRTYIALEGDNSAYVTGNMENTYLTSPRLDLSKATAPHKFMFTYYANFNGEGDQYLCNDLSVWVSTDGGQTFSDSVWVADYTKTDSIINVTIDLSKYTSDNVKLRFKNQAIGFGDSGADPWATFYIDRVLLPSVYGVDGVPFTSSVITPADAAKDIYNKNVQFSWTEAQFATGYKIYIGKSSTTFDVVNGEDVGDATTYTLATADYETTYYWKVVPYNSVGSAADAPVWSFTTQKDMTISTFPWTEGFEDKTFAPLGWNAENTSLTKWNRNDSYPFNGEASASAFSNETEKTTTLTSPDIKLPAGSKYQLGFWWGNDHPVNLKKDEINVRINNSTAEDGIDAVFFDIFVDGAWQQVKLISDNAEDGVRYWAYESLDLTPYAGKTIALRWRYISHNYNQSRGAALDDVKISSDGASVSINTDGWDAYKVNYGKKEVSPQFAISNLGNKDVTVNKVGFTSPNFSSTLTDGTTIPAKSAVKFTVAFDAGNLATADSVNVDDQLTLTLSDGSSISMPVHAYALAADCFFYGFEHDATGQLPAEFTGIDVDGAITAPVWSWTVPNLGAALSYFVLNDSQCNAVLKEPHGHQSLMTRCNNNGSYDDWLVSRAFYATATSKLQFNARTWESVNSVLPGKGPNIKVWVSETSATNRSTFTQVGEAKELGLFNNVSWDQLTYDLSAYAGKKIYIAVEAQASNSLGGFYDNFEFLHVTTEFSGVNNIAIDQLANEEVAVYLLNGVKVAQGKGVIEGLDKGVYIIKTQAGKAFKILK